MSRNPNLLSLSHLEDACGHLFFWKTLYSKPVIFPCLCIKRNRWCKPQGDKANKTQPPCFQHSQRCHLIHIGPQMAFTWDQHLHLARHIQGVQQCSLTPERTWSWKWTFGRSPPLPMAWVAFLPINCVFSPQGKVLTVLYLTKYPVLWSIRPLLPACSTQKPPYCPRITEPQPTRNTKV